MSSHSPRALHGVLLFLCAVVLFACQDACAKYLTAHWPIALLAWVRYTVHFSLMSALLLPHRGRDLLRTRRPVAQVLRGLCLVSVTVLMMTAFQRLPLAEATTIMFASPLLVVLASRPLLQERIGALRWAAVLVGFAGVLLITRPGGGLDPWGVAAALAASVVYAVYQLMTRQLSSTETPATLLYYTALTGVFCLSFGLPANAFGRAAAPYEYGLMLALGVLGGGSHYLLTRAFREAPASLLSPLSYTQLIWAGLLGWIIFGDRPGAGAGLGMLVVAASGVLIALDSRRATARPAS
ncbi:DMT family transporter [Niveibacterium sp. SC-1]|uniref:DMT family transporter n=1 Tax=Niveibacterium sp. SC-1 TaxID=3135646 RepID=UPI00311ECE4E